MIPATPGSRPSKSSKTPSMARSNITSCFRCRQKKKRCDQRLPICGLCEAAGAECVGYDAVARRHVPRSYVHSLEERVAYLELELQKHGITENGSENLKSSTISYLVANTQPDSSPQGRLARNSTTIETNETGLAANGTMDRVLELVQRRSEEEPAFSKIFLAELMKANIAPAVLRGRASRQFSAEKHLQSNIMNELDNSPVSLPTKEAAQDLIKAYFQFANLSLPLLHEPTFMRKMDFLYDMPRIIDFVQAHTSNEAKIAVFFVFEVFAVAILMTQKQDPSRIPTSLADRYHKTALRALNEAGLPSAVEGVQALLLVGQYCYHHPTLWAVWKTVGAALRLAVELGLHQDQPADEFDPLTLDTMRRTFWVAYAMDRNISIAFSMPSCLSDGAITAKFPSQENDEYITPNGILAPDMVAFKTKSISTHLFRFRQIQSEMQTVLYERPSPASAVMDLGQWQQSMRDRIREWYEDTPSSSSATNREREILENFELTFHRALFYLYHPSLRIPEPPEVSLLAMTEAAIKMIQLYRQFFDEHRLTIYWQAVENLSSAGTALIFSYVNSSAVQEQVSLRSLESHVRTCSSVLWGMVEHFPDFKRKREAFDITASQILAYLSANSTATGSLENHARPNDYLGSRMDIESPKVTSYATTDKRQELMSAVNEPHELASEATFAAAAERTQCQPRQSSLPTTGSMPDMYTSQEPFSFSDFNDLPFDWDVFENTNQALMPTRT